MKKITSIFAATLISVTAYSQKNEIAIESYRAFQFTTPQSFGAFDSEYLGLNNGSDQSGVRFALGLNYTRSLKNNWFVRFRPGVSIDTRKDDAYQLYNNEFGYDKYEAEIYLEYKRTSLNLFIGGGKEYQLSERFSLAVGLDVGFVADLSNSVAQNLTIDVDYEQNDYSATQVIDYRRKFAHYKRIGLMPIISPKFKLSDAFSISLELQCLATFSFANGEEEYVYKDIYTENNQGIMNLYEYDTDITFNSKASMFSVSKLSPLLRFSYHF